MNNLYKKRRASETLVYVVLIISAILTLLPLYWLLSSTFKTSAEAIGYPPSLFPKHPTVKNFGRLFDANNFNFLSYYHSLVIALGAMVLSCTVATLAGYGLSRFKFPGKKPLMVSIMFFQMVPILALIIPLYQIFSIYGLYNTHIGLILIYATLSAPMNTWVLKGYFDTIPDSIEEAAMIDGLSKTQAFLRIAIPIAIPGLSASAIFAFFKAWNEYIVAMTLTSSVRPYTVELYRFIGEQGEVDWSLLGTASFIAIVPIFILFSCAQKYFIIGLSGGAIKS
ncbi:MAG: carbohydrate ABC transporter permease [Sphaerochaetaceae bacterium]|nr:carbohydrate ABC transporter permease [Sphaerochaetaceae bacterium]